MRYAVMAYMSRFISCELTSYINTPRPFINATTHVPSFCICKQWHLLQVHYWSIYNYSPSIAMSYYIARGSQSVLQLRLLSFHILHCSNIHLVRLTMLRSLLSTTRSPECKWSSNWLYLTVALLEPLTQLPKSEWEDPILPHKYNWCSNNETIHNKQHSTDSFLPPSLLYISVYSSSIYSGSESSKYTHHDTDISRW